MPTLTQKEKEYLMLKVSRELYATQKRIEALERGAALGYIPNRILEQEAPERTKKYELEALLNKLTKFETEG